MAFFFGLGGHLSGDRPWRVGGSLVVLGFGIADHWRPNASVCLEPGRMNGAHFLEAKMRGRRAGSAPTRIGAR